VVIAERVGCLFFIDTPFTWSFIMHGHLDNINSAKTINRNFAATLVDSAKPFGSQRATFVHTDTIPKHDIAVTHQETRKFTVSVFGHTSPELTLVDAVDRVETALNDLQARGYTLESINGEAIGQQDAAISA